MGKFSMCVFAMFAALLLVGWATPAMAEDPAGGAGAGDVEDYQSPYRSEVDPLMRGVIGDADDASVKGLKNTILKLLDLMRMFGLVAILISLCIGAVMMGLKQSQGLMFVVWGLLGGVIFFGAAQIMRWLMGKQAGNNP